MSSKEAESILDWWEEAGVDTIVGETPRDWLAVKPRPTTAFVAAPAAPAMAEPAPAPILPDTIDSFQAWFVDGLGLPLGAPGAPRVGPSGDPASGLMILVDMPGPADFAASTLLAGEVGTLFDKMMGAIGRGRETLYLASLSPLRTPTGTLDPATAANLATIARHHIGLAAPRALLLFGDIASKALTGGTVAGARQRWHEIDTPAGRIKTLVTMKPEKDMIQPLKKLVWEDLQMLMEGLKP
ncbi:MAG TPA: uracil-DNA glycosylase family protein [Allosphingosinicella sp.]